MIVVLSGPSGVGKNTVGEGMLRSMPEMTRVVTATTRSPRTGEQDGVDYHFWTQQRFDRAIERSELLEWAEVVGCRYGTPVASVTSALAAGKIALLIIDVVGAESVKRLVPEAFRMFLDSPDDGELESRLRGRGTDAEEKIQRRLARARSEREAAGTYDEVLVNDDLDRCVAEAVALVRARHARAQTGGTWQRVLERLNGLMTGAGQRRP
jgi:guanylate kinase